MMTAARIHEPRPRASARGSRDVRRWARAGASVLALSLALSLSGTAYAGEMTAHVRKATCENPKFGFRVENPNDHQRRFTVVLWHGIRKDKHLFLRDRAPAWGGIRGVVSPDWNRRSFYVVEVFSSWKWRPWSHRWRVNHWLAGASARLDDC